MIKILLVDNNDSFVYNLVEILRLQCSVDVVLTGDLYEGIEKDYQKILLSPGAALPGNYPQMMQLISRCAKTHSILGVCLGCQAIGENFGASIIQLEFPKHGHCSRLKLLKKDEILFDGIPDNSHIGRYHSWVINPYLFPDTLEVLAIDEDDNIMAIKHRDLSIYGVQFHPESIISEYGRIMLENWILKEI